jgi:putative transferase (TIGR04331 family)
MDNIYLITTADKRCQPSNFKSLFLGDWCFNYDVDQLKKNVTSYHWNDRKKLFHDYIYLKRLNASIIETLADSLNRYHGTNFSKRYWQVLIGPWLMYFIHIVFDRWSCVVNSIKDGQAYKSLTINFELDDLIPLDMNDFRIKICEDYWNHYIFSQILEDFDSIELIPISIIKKTPSRINFLNVIKMTLKSFRFFLFKMGTHFLMIFSKETDHFVYSSFLTFKQSFLLQFSLKQIPVFFPEEKTPKANINFSERGNLNFNFNDTNEFEFLLKRLIPENIPVAYLEGYSNLKNKASKVNWPKSPKSIFTAVGYNSDEVFKIWSAGKIEEGVPFVIGQHGGHIGSALFSGTEDHEFDISDRYLTWGWTNNSKKSYPIGIIKKFGKRKLLPSPDGFLLLISGVMPKYSYILGSYTIATSQVNENLEDQYMFVSHLSSKIYSQLLVRLFIPDWGWNQRARWTDKFPNIKLDDGKKSLDKLVKRCRLYVTTYNATTLLEALSDNIPTIAFWNPKNWELREEAIPYFAKLEEVGILHQSPESAANKVNLVWDNIGEWWFSSDVQTVRDFFCEKFCRMPINPTFELSKAVSKFV